MTETASISASIAGRYAQALFGIARDEGARDRLEADVETLSAALAASADLRAVIASPRVPAGERVAATAALAQAMDLAPMTGNTLGLMASKGRLFVLPHFLDALRALIAADKGEVTAEVTSATALTEAQAQRIADLLRARFGKDVKLRTAVDAGLIGGLVVKVGSKMIDTSVRAKLARLKNAMKEVG